jgi:hypothetical protein
MRAGLGRSVFCLIALSLLLAACGQQATPELAPTGVRPSDTPPGASPISGSVLSSPKAPSPSPTPVSPTPAASATPRATPTPLPATFCRLGTGLRDETSEILVKYKANPGFVMTGTVDSAQTYFSQFEGWIRGIGAPSLDALRQIAARAQELGIPYEALVYGLETGKSTPDEEWQDPIGSTEKARALADQYGKLLVMGPGYQLMSANEDKYASMAALADIWVFQTQRLQKNPPGDVYRDKVKRVVELIRAGNPSIQIWAQITLPPDREPDAEEWLAYRQQIDDLVNGTYVGIYTWKTVDAQILVSTADAIFAGACGGE